MRTPCLPSVDQGNPGEGHADPDPDAGTEPLALGSKAFHQSLGYGGDDQQQAALGEQQAQEVAEQRGGFCSDDGAAQ